MHAPSCARVKHRFRISQVCLDRFLAKDLTPGVRSQFHKFTVLAGFRANDRTVKIGRQKLAMLPKPVQAGSPGKFVPFLQVLVGKTYQLNIRNVSQILPIDFSVKMIETEYTNAHACPVPENKHSSSRSSAIFHGWMRHRLKDSALRLSAISSPVLAWLQYC